MNAPRPRAHGPYLIAATTILVLAAIALALLTQASSPSAPAADRPSAQAPRPPLVFVPNRGQTDQRVNYVAQAPGFAAFFMDGKVVLSLEQGDLGHALELRFLNANSGVEPTPSRRARGTVSYMRGDRSNWRTGLSTYQRLTYRELWPGVDLVFRFAGAKLEYDLVVESEATLERIGLAYAGAERLSLDSGGRLLIHTPLGVLSETAPQSYQVIEGRKVAVASRFTLRERANQYGFGVGRGYDRRYPLVIDPGLSYSTFLGESGVDTANAVAVDRHRNLYVTGSTTSTNFPTTPGAFRTGIVGGQDAFVAKLDPSGSQLVYSTYLGGTSALEDGFGIAVDGRGSAYVVGTTASADFPTTAGAFAPASSSPGAYEGFVTKLGPEGSDLAYSTYLGGSSSFDDAAAIAVDRRGSAYVTGSTRSTDFPVTPGAFDTTPPEGPPGLGPFHDAYVSKFNRKGSKLLFSTYLGGRTLSDVGLGIAVDQHGSAYVTGETDADDFPVTPGAPDAGLGGSFDAFMTKLSRDGSALDYSTYMGGELEDVGEAIAVDRRGSAYITGVTQSGDLPFTPGAYDTSINGTRDAYVTRLGADGTSFDYVSYLGGGGNDLGHAIAVDRWGAAYVSGTTHSSNFPTTADPVGVFDGTFFGDAYLAKLNAPGSSLEYSSYLGGSSPDHGFGVAVDDSAAVYLSGDTRSSDFTTTPGAFDLVLDGASDGFVTRLDPIR